MKSLLYPMSVVATLVGGVLALVFWALAMLHAAGISAAISGASFLVWGYYSVTDTWDELTGLVIEDERRRLEESQVPE